MRMMSGVGQAPAGSRLGAGGMVGGGAAGAAEGLGAGGAGTGAGGTVGGVEALGPGVADAIGVGEGMRFKANRGIAIGMVIWPPVVGEMVIWSPLGEIVIRPPLAGVGEGSVGAVGCSIELQASVMAAKAHPKKDKRRKARPAGRGAFRSSFMGASRYSRRSQTERPQSVPIKNHMWQALLGQELKKYSKAPSPRPQPPNGQGALSNPSPDRPRKELVIPCGPLGTWPSPRT